MHERVQLDEWGCISLSDVLHAFTTGVKEEQAWALCHQVIKAGQAVLNTPEDKTHALLITETFHVKLNQDGSIHKNTFLLEGEPQGKGPSRAHSSDECKFISKLTHAVHDALEYGFEEEAERLLSPDLEEFLEKMMDADESVQKSDDEGIERDSADDQLQPFNFQSLLKVCRDRLGSSPNGGSSSSGSLSDLCQSGSGNNGDQTAADNYYKAVLRTLVADTLELSTFLEKVAQGKHELRAPRCSSRNSGGSSSDGGFGEGIEDLTVWARSWVQVVRDLRIGVKLKKVDSCDSSGRECLPKEYELTPYEIFLKDIRSRSSQLKPVMVDGSPPQRVKRDAHELILEFVRGRPPLRKAADRVLAPPPEENLSPVKALLKSITTGYPHTLKPTITVVRTFVQTGSIRHQPAPRGQTSHEMTADRSSASESSPTSTSQASTTSGRPRGRPRKIVQVLRRNSKGRFAQAQIEAA